MCGLRADHPEAVDDQPGRKGLVMTMPLELSAIEVVYP